ncbi:hypothetical protein H312_00786 [Anncaliia algerae PRA339]|uniref:Mediator of RNA polymerase II transcription subunit 31 n=1 Tax=Anncaliia algerae PRA339 TaxID=1288291 RepID=A0A059F456_9MICR|nr:hypothetical protein H312_00786 [Anncaliia algerae PRA339]
MASQFEYDLEFIQLLTNPNYLLQLKNKGYFENEKFIEYLKYLRYFYDKPYIYYITYPASLPILESLINNKENKNIVEDIWMRKLL